MAGSAMKPGPGSAIKSMTGFGTADGALGPLTWTWEVRSVNGRGLDVRMRLPPGYEGLESRIRDLCAKRLHRGSISLTLTTRRTEGGIDLKLNESALAEVMAAIAKVRAAGDVAPPTADGILAIKGVLEARETTESEAEADARIDAMMDSLGTALDALITSRRAEGERLAVIIRNQLDEVARQVAIVEVAPARSPDAIRNRLGDHVRKLLDASGHQLDPARLHQEAALLATRIDVEEELKRLSAHIEAARDLLDASEPAGRKFDFLAQEFNREANTLCSKANDAAITRAGLALKAVIDQMREQVQNLE